MSHKILVIGPAADRQRFLTPDVAQLLTAAGEIHHVDLPAVEETQRAEAFDRTVKDAHALICMPWGRQSLPVFSADRWEKAAKLRVIAGTFDHRFEPSLDVADAHRRGVAVIDDKTSEADLDAMAQAGIRGIRLNVEEAGEEILQQSGTIGICLRKFTHRLTHCISKCFMSHFCSGGSDHRKASGEKILFSKTEQSGDQLASG